MSLRATRSIVRTLAITMCACSASPTMQSPSTRVAAERRVLSNDPALAEYFAAVYGHQRALAEVARRRMDGFAALAGALDLPENADRDTMLLAIRDAFRREGARDVILERAEDEPDDAVDAWHRALHAPTQDERGMREDIEAKFRAVRDGVLARPNPAPPQSLAPLVAALVEIHREATATRLCMLRLTGTTAAPLQRGAALFAAHPELAAEFRAAETAVLGFHVRATRHAQESLRTAQWVEDALRAPEGSSTPTADAGTARDQ